MLTYAQVNLEEFNGQIIVLSPLRLSGHWLKHHTNTKTGPERHIISVEDGWLLRLVKGRYREFACIADGKVECIRKGLVEDTTIHFLFPETMGLAAEIEKRDREGWRTPIPESARQAAASIVPSGLDLSEWPLRFMGLQTIFIYRTPLGSVRFVLRPAV